MTELYCIETHHQGAVVRGNIYSLLGAMPCFCGCGEALVNVGIKGKSSVKRCIITKREAYLCDGIWWIRAKLFANIDDISLEEVEEILEHDLIEI